MNLWWIGRIETVFGVSLLILRGLDEGEMEGLGVRMLRCGFGGVCDRVGRCMGLQVCVLE